MVLYVLELLSRSSLTQYLVSLAYKRQRKLEIMKKVIILLEIIVWNA
jgi:hypothetical protein